MQKQVSILSEQTSQEEKLSESLKEIEELQHELSREREEKENRLAELQEEIKKLQDDLEAEKNKSRYFYSCCCI